MNKVFTLLFSLLSVTASFCQTFIQNEEFNFDFEQTTGDKKLPDKWFQWGKDYNLTIDSVTKYSGKKSLHIEPLSDKSLNTFGCVAYKIPSVYSGLDIELKAYMKYTDVTEGFVGLLLRIDGESDVLKFDNMQKKNIQGTSDWKRYSVKLPYPEDAKDIYIGAILTGKGQLWVDSLELLIDGIVINKAKRSEIKEYIAEKDHEFDKSSKIESLKISGSNIKNIALLGKIWGFLKYYHPGAANGNYNWDYELFRILPKYSNAKKIAERDKILEDWINSLEPFEIGKDTIIEMGKVKIKPDVDWIYNTDLSLILHNNLRKINKANRNNINYYIKLNDGVRNPLFKNEKAYAEMKFPDTGYRLLALFRYWNIIQYYYPYRNLIEKDWERVLEEFIPKFINVQNELDYKLVVLELIGKVHDTHANIWGFDPVLEMYKGRNYAPVEISFIENKAVVTDYYDNELGEKTGLQKGDVISKINNKPIKQIVSEKLKYTPGSNYTTQLRDIAFNLLRTNDSVFEVEYIHNNKPEITKINTYSNNKINIYKKYQNKDTCFKFIKPEIGYIFLGNIKTDYLRIIMNEVKNTKGLIIDIRCYPSEFVVFSLGEYLMLRSTPFVKFSNGSVKTPGFFSFTDNLFVGKDNPKYYQGKVIILVNESTQSQAEYTTMAFRVAPKATVIGSQTAGADGNVSEFYLPGGIKTMISGIGVYYPDGRETQQVGIIPDIEVKRTIEGIKLNIDELIEKAIEIIN
jgi:C-terminal processing protease CtpA/Prc